jgi:hypothetical protein
MGGGARHAPVDGGAVSASLSRLRHPRPARLRLTCLLALTVGLLIAPTALSRPAAAPLRLASEPVAGSATFSSGTHLVVGFGPDKARLVPSAAAIGITADILYEGPPQPKTPLGRALAQAHITAIDARVSDELHAWECHRTHTVAPPPNDGSNSYCATDIDPTADSTQVVLARAREYLREDAENPLVGGYWVLDDWPYWDGGSARQLLDEVHAEIEEVTPGYPAICGFGGEVEGNGEPRRFDPSTAANYSSAGCDMVGVYNYADPVSKPSDGEGFEWTMGRLLKEEGEDLGGFGWVNSETPLLGIGQAWSGRVGKHEYEPGLSSAQMVAQAQAFCSNGASSIGWYGWEGFKAPTHTAANSSVIQQGIKEGAAACGTA